MRRATKSGPLLERRSDRVTRKLSLRYVAGAPYITLAGKKEVTLCSILSVVVSPYIR